MKDEPRTPNRKRISFSLRTMLFAVATIAVFLSFVILPLENRRRGIERLRRNGVRVELEADPTDSISAAAYGYQFVEPGWFTSLLHKVFPKPYLLQVHNVHFGQDSQPTANDFHAIGQLGPVHSVDVCKTSILSPSHLDPIVDSQDVGGLYFSLHPVDEQVLAQVGRMKQLQHLYFYRAPLTKRGLSHVANLTQLRRLWLKGANCQSNSLSVVANLTELRELEIQEPGVSPESLNHLSRLTKLRRLDLTDVQTLSDQHTDFLTNMQQLNHLYLTDHLITDQTLSKLANATQLKYLLLDGTLVNGSGFYHLSRMDRLTRLNLTDTPTASGMDTLAGLPALQSIDLSGTKVDDDAISTLATSKSLETVQLYGTGITDIGLLSFLETPRLEVIDVSQTLVTTDAVDRFRLARPNVRVQTDTRR